MPGRRFPSWLPIGRRERLSPLLAGWARAAAGAANSAGQAALLAAASRKGGGEEAARRLGRVRDLLAAGAARAPVAGGGFPSGLERTLLERTRDLRAADLVAMTLASRWYEPSRRSEQEGGDRVPASLPADLPLHKALNLRRNDLEILLGRSGLASLPAVLYPDPGGACNLRCPTCPCHGPESGHRTLPGIVSDAVFSRLVSILPAVHAIGIFGSGEPLLSPRLAGLLREAERCGCRVELATNGTHAARAAVALPEGDGLTLVVSVDGATRETFETLRDGASLDRVVEGIRELRRLRPRLPLAFNVTVSRANLEELPGIVDLAASLGVGSVRLSPLVDYRASLYHRRLALRKGDLPALGRAVEEARRRAAAGEIALADGVTPVEPREESDRAWERRRRREREAAPADEAARSDDELVRRVEEEAELGLALPDVLRRAEPPDAASTEPGAPEPLPDLLALEEAARRRLAAGRVQVPWCLAPFRVAVPQAGGGIAPCCLVTDLFGDFSEVPFAEAWNAPAYRALRESMGTGEGRPASCLDCTDAMRAVRLDSLVRTAASLLPGGAGRLDLPFGRTGAASLEARRAADLWGMRIVESGPVEVEAGGSFNVQPDGSSALWTRVEEAPASAVVVLGEERLATRNAGEVVTATVPAAAVAAPSLLPLALFDPASGALSNAVPLRVGAGRSKAPGPLRLAWWFGEEAPTNLWTSDLSGAAGDFRLMRDDGFDAVGLVVPWGLFQPRLDPAEEDAAAHERLRAVLAEAGRAGLRPLLRLTFLWDFAEEAESPGAARIERLLAEPAVREAWAGHVRAVRETARRAGVEALALLSWEDLLVPVLEKVPAWEEGKRLAFLRGSGFVSYCAGRGAGCGPGDPAPGSPAWRLWLEFLDDVVATRLFPAASAAWPGLSLEVRSDWDPVVLPDGTTGWHEHRALHRLPGAAVPAGYFTVSMGGENRGEPLAAAEALRRLDRFLARMEGAEGRKILLAQLAWSENAPGFEAHGRLGDEEAAAFLEGAAGPLGARSAGWGLWTWREYALSLVRNPSFALGLDGWTVEGPAEPVRSGDGRCWVRLGSGASLRQEIPRARDWWAEAAPPRTLEATFATEGSLPAVVSFRTGAAIRRFEVPPGEATLRLAAGPPASSDAVEVALESGGPVRLRAVRLFGLVQESGVRRRDGSAGPLLDSVRRLNALLGSSALQRDARITPER